MIACLKSSKNSHRIAKQFLRHYSFLSQRSCRLSRDRRQLSYYVTGIPEGVAKKTVPVHRVSFWRGGEGLLRDCLLRMRWMLTSGSDPRGCTNRKICFFVQLLWNENNNDKHTTHKLSGAGKLVPREICRKYF